MDLIDETFLAYNGARLKDLLSVRDLVEELTQDPGLRRASA